MFTDQKVVLVQACGGSLGEIRFRYDSWRFLPFADVDITYQQITGIAKKLKELDDNERS